MAKFDGVLICTDLDGTLLRNDKTVSKENREAIEYFKREGGYFTFVTGRLPYYSHEAYNAVNPNAPFGSVNGGALYDGERGEYVKKCELSAGFVELIECIDEKFPTVGIQVCCFDKTYFSKDNEAMVKFRAATHLPRLVRSYREVSEPVAKIIFVTDDEREILAVEGALREHPLAHRFDFVRSERTLFEILPKGVNKGLAIKNLVVHLGVKPEKTIAIGDYDNDVGMLREAGVGIAVANASPSAREAADVITVSNEEHAIARVIYDLEAGVFGI